MLVLGYAERSKLKVIHAVWEIDNLDRLELTIKYSGVKMSRILFSLFTVATLAVCASPALAQTTCPYKEILIFGSSYGYSAITSSKSGEGCDEKASGAVLFYPNKVTISI